MDPPDETKQTIDDLVYESMPKLLDVLEVDDLQEAIEDEINRRKPDLDLEHGDLSYFHVSKALKDTTDSWKLARLYKILHRGKRRIEKIQREMQRARAQVATRIVDSLGDLAKVEKYIARKRELDKHYEECESDFDDE